MERVRLADEQKKSKTKKKKQATAAAQPHRSTRTQRGPPKDADKRSTKRQSKKSTIHEEEKMSTDACYICGISEVSDWMACELCDRWVCSGCLPADLDKTDTFLCDNCGTCIY